MHNVIFMALAGAVVAGYIYAEQNTDYLERMQYALGIDKSTRSVPVELLQMTSQMSLR